MLEARLVVDAVMKELMSRKGFRQLLDEIEDRDPETFSDIKETLLRRVSLILNHEGVLTSEQRVERMKAAIADAIEATDDVGNRHHTRWLSMTRTNLQHAGLVALFAADEILMEGSTSVDAKSADMALTDALRSI